MSETETYPTLISDKEAPEEAALAQWFADQRTKSVDNLEAAARQIITLCTTLLGVLLGLMSLTKDNLPPYMHWSGVQWLSGLGVVGLFVALACALYVVLPRHNPVTLNDPDSLQTVFQSILERKHVGLRWAIISFAGAMLCLVLVLVISLALIT